jgi:hypothetical protein
VCPASIKERSREARSAGQETDADLYRPHVKWPDEDQRGTRHSPFDDTVGLTVAIAVTGTDAAAFSDVNFSITERRAARRASERALEVYVRMALQTICLRDEERAQPRNTTSTYQGCGFAACRGSAAAGFGAQRCQQRLWRQRRAPITAPNASFT